MRFLQVHLSSRGGGARAAVGYIESGLRLIGQECVSTFSDPRLELDRCDFVLLHGFEDCRANEFSSLLEDVRRRGVPHAVLMHDYWPICRQTNLCQPDRGWVRCTTPCDCEECYGPLPEGWPTLPKDEVLVCFSQQSAHHFRRDGRLVRVIPHGVDLEAFRPAEWWSESTPPRVLFADAWGEKDVKGFRHWRWLQGRLADRLSFGEVLGEMPHDRMPQFYAGGDCFLFLSLWDETFGLVLAEAMACGLPIISYPVGIAPQAVEDGVNGRLVGTSSPQEVLEALEWFVALNPDERARMSHQSRLRAEEMFSLERMATEYVRLAGGLIL